MVNKIQFKSITQKALFIYEIQGQLSDGQWENLSVRNHWQPWCDITIENTLVGDTLGRNFYPRYCSYRLNASDLLDVVGDRMLIYARLAQALPIEHVGIIAECFLSTNTFRGIPEWMHAAQREIVEMYDMDEIRAVVETKHNYDKKDLAADLKEMRKAFKTHINL